MLDLTFEMFNSTELKRIYRITRLSHCHRCHHCQNCQLWPHQLQTLTNPEHHRLALCISEKPYHCSYMGTDSHYTSSSTASAVPSSDRGVTVDVSWTKRVDFEVVPGSNLEPLDGWGYPNHLPYTLVYNRMKVLVGTHHTLCFGDLLHPVLGNSIPQVILAPSLMTFCQEHSPQYKSGVDYFVKRDASSLLPGLHLYQNHLLTEVSRTCWI